MRRFIPIFLSLLVLISAAVYTPLSLDKRKSISEVEAKAQLEPSTVDITHDYGRLIQHSPANWTLYNRAVAVNVIWDGTYAYCRLLNNTVDEPWRAYPISYWSMWHFEFLGAGEKWKEDVAANVLFSSAVQNASGAFLVERMTLPSLGSTAQITYKVLTDGKLKWDIKFTAGAAEDYRIRYRMDTIPSQHVKLEVAKQILFSYSPSYNVTFFYDDVNQALYPCSDMYDEGKHKFYFDISLGTLTAGQTVEIDPSTVASSSIYSAIQYSFQRKSFYANGRFWVWYSDGTDLGYKTSTDGASWSSFTGVRACAQGWRFSVWFNGTYLHYAYHSETSGDPLLYRRGTPNSDGTVTWSAAEQTAVSGTSGVTLYDPMIAVDGGGYPWIGYQRYNGTYYYPYVTKASTNDGTWTTASGFPYQLSSAASSNDWAVSITPLTNQRVLATYGYVSSPVKAKLWSGSAWGDEESASTSNLNYGDYHSAVAEGDDVHLVFLKLTAHDIIYVKRTYSSSSWSSEATVYASAHQYSAPVLSINATNNKLYCFWAGAPTANHIYYKKCVSGTWDSSPTDWITESSLTSNDRLTCFYQAYASKIGLVYMTTPTTIRFGYLALNPPTNDACASTSFFGLGVYNWVNVTVSDLDLVADLNTVSIQVNTTGDAQTFTLRWTQSSGLFSEVSDPSGICTLGSSVRVNIDSDTDKIAFRFKFTSGAYGLCDVKAVSTDDGLASDTDLYGDQFTLTDIQLGSLAVASASGTHNTQFNVTATWAHNSSAVNGGTFYVYESSQLASATSDSAGLVQFTLTGVTLHGSGTLTVNGTKSGVKVNSPLTVSYDITVSGLASSHATSISEGSKLEIAVNFKNIANLSTTNMPIENVTVVYRVLKGSELLLEHNSTAATYAWGDCEHGHIMDTSTLPIYSPYTVRVILIQRGSEYVLASVEHELAVTIIAGGGGGLLEISLIVESLSIEAPVGKTTLIEVPVRIKGATSAEIVNVTVSARWVQIDETLPKTIRSLPATIRLAATPPTEGVYTIRVMVKAKSSGHEITTTSNITLDTYVKAPAPSPIASTLILVGLAGLFGFLVISGRKKRRGEY